VSERSNSDFEMLEVDYLIIRELPFELFCARPGLRDLLI
jgi:hypothetical protein